MSRLADEKQLPPEVRAEIEALRAQCATLSMEVAKLREAQQQHSELQQDLKIEQAEAARAKSAWAAVQAENKKLREQLVSLPSNIIELPPFHIQQIMFTQSQQLAAYQLTIAQLQNQLNHLKQLATQQSQHIAIQNARLLEQAQAIHHQQQMNQFLQQQLQAILSASTQPVPPTELPLESHELKQETPSALIPQASGPVGEGSPPIQGSLSNSSFFSLPPLPIPTTGSLPAATLLFAQAADAVTAPANPTVTATGAPVAVATNLGPEESAAPPGVKGLSPTHDPIFTP